MALSFRQRIGAAFKAAGIAFGSNYSSLGSFFYGLLPGSKFNYTKEVGPAWLNSAVSIGVGWIQDNFSEPALQVVRYDKQNEAQPVPTHPLLDLLETPNPYDDFDALMMATVISYLVDGNAYWVKDRGGQARVRQLWYVPHWAMELDYNDQGLPIRYLYKARGTSFSYPLSEVVHFKWGKDPENPFYGLGRLKPLLREIFTDNQIATYTASLLRNAGVPSVMLSPKDPTVTIDKAGRDGLKEIWRSSTTGDNIGAPIVPSAAMDVTMMGFSPEQLALDKIGQVPEARICAALRLSPMLLGLNAGLEHSTYANMEEARRGAYMDCLIPLQKRFAKTINAALMPDVGGRDGEVLRWDYTGVQAMAENQDDLAKRAVTLFKGDVFMRSESRALMGHDSTPEDEVYSTDIAAAAQAAQIALQGDLLGPMKTDSAKAFKAARAAAIAARRISREREPTLGAVGS